MTQATNYLELNSVNSIIDVNTLIIYKKSDKTKSKGISVDDAKDSWFNKLSDYDFGTMDSLINNRNL
jgi:hypothetical protein